MKILKYKKIKNKYRIFFDNDKTIDLYENIILKNNLLLKKEISNSDLEIIKLDNEKEEIYELALSYIKIKMRSKKEIYNYLIKKGYDKNEINKVIDRLEKESYINEELYIKSCINDKLYLSNDGPNKIKNNLINEGFSVDLVDNALDNNDIDLYQKLEKLIDKKISSIKNYSGEILKLKLITYFINLGYDKELIERVLSNKNLNNSNGEKEYYKIYNKYSKKFSGEQLEYVIRQRLYQKGYNYDEIKKNIN